MASLGTTALAGLPPEVAVPAYDRSDFSSQIVHIGPGNFHRAHQGFYLDSLRSSGDLEWGMRDVGIMDRDAQLVEDLAVQSNLYTIRETSPESGLTHRISGAVSEVNRPGDTGQILAWLSDARTKIVSLTITEGGYFREPATGHFAVDHPAVALEWNREEPGNWNRAEPRNVFGFLVRALAERRVRGIAPFTLLSCDNLLDNGRAAREALIGFARGHDEEFADWLEENVHTPSCMVDGITPAATPEDRRDIADFLGVEDLAPVTCEPFRQWVIEDDFPTGRPRWQSVGAELVEDVAPYEHMKLRLLNAGHQALAHLGALAGFSHMHIACLDPDISGFLQAFWNDEAQPVCPQIPGVDLDEYCGVLRSRFSNPGIADTIARNAAQGSDRIPGFVLPTVVDNLDAGGPVEAGALIVAAWARGMQGRDDHGNALVPVDDRLAELLPLLGSTSGPPMELLRHPQLASVGNDPRLRKAFRDAYMLLENDGALAAARALTMEKDKRS